MKIPKRRCRYCHRWFQPDPRFAASQKYCSHAQCRRESRLASHRRWWSKNGRETDVARASKHETWAKEKNYWPTYRAEHPEYALRDNDRRRRAHQGARRAANQDMSRKISVDKLHEVLHLGVDNAANQDTFHRQIKGVVNYLLWKEGAANQDITDLATTLT